MPQEATEEVVWSGSPYLVFISMVYLYLCSSSSMILSMVCFNSCILWYLMVSISEYLFFPMLLFMCSMVNVLCFYGSYLWYQCLHLFSVLSMLPMVLINVSVISVYFKDLINLCVFYQWSIYSIHVFCASLVVINLCSMVSMLLRVEYALMVNMLHSYLFHIYGLLHLSMSISISECFNGRSSISMCSMVSMLHQGSHVSICIMVFICFYVRVECINGLFLSIQCSINDINMLQWSIQCMCSYSMSLSMVVLLSECVLMSRMFCVINACFICVILSIQCVLWSCIYLTYGLSVSICFIYVSYLSMVNALCQSVNINLFNDLLLFVSMVSMRVELLRFIMSLYCVCVFIIMIGFHT